MRGSEQEIFVIIAADKSKQIVGRLYSWTSVFKYLAKNGLAVPFPPNFLIFIE